MRFVRIAAVYGIYSFLSLFTSLALATDNWVLQKDDEGIQVFTKDIRVDFSDQSLIADQSTLLDDAISSEQKAFRGVIVMNVSMDKMLDTIRDVANFQQWLYNSYDLKMVESQTNDSWVLYQKISTPWPTSDRDSVLKQWITKEGEDYFLYMRSASHEKAPVNEDFVRVPYFKGYFQFTPLNDQQVKVTYEAAFDTGGYVPAFVSNLFIVDTPFYSLDGLRAYLQ